MGLALLDVADVIRPFPEVVEYLQRGGLSQIKDEHFPDERLQFDGGKEARARIWFIGRCRRGECYQANQDGHRIRVNGADGYVEIL